MSELNVDTRKHAGATVSWALGLAACLCNLTIVLLPIGLPLGLAGLILGAVAAARDRASRQAFLGESGNATRRGVPGMALSGISFLVGAVWAGTVVSVFLVDPTLR